MTEPMIGAVDAVNVAISRNHYGDVIFGLADKPASEFILQFDLHADRFVGRSAVFAALDAFSSQHRCGYFELVAAAGLGKTAFAAEVARRKSAIAFFASVGYGTVHAEQFLAHTSAELLTRYPLGRTSLPVSVGDSAAVLSLFLRESVEHAVGEPLWIVVDGLDEAEAPPVGANPLLLPLDLPAGVFVVITRRTGSMVANPATPVGRYELRHDAAIQEADIVEFLWDRVTTDERIQTVLAKARPATTPSQFVSALARASEGNFMYLSFVLADLVEAEPSQAIDPARLPNGLYGYYDQFWGRMSDVRDEDWTTWDGLHRPTLERLAVAYEAVPATWLASQVGRPADEIRARVLDRWRRVLAWTRQNNVETWRLVHRTFSDYLRDEGRVDLNAAHAAVAASYVDRLEGRFEDWDAYGLRHAATHLAEAARSAPDAERHRFVAALVRLVVDERFIRRQLAAKDPVHLERSLERALRTAAEDESPDATGHVVAVALTLLRFRRQLLQPATIFEVAGRGDVAAARQLLELMADGLEQDWQRALTLTIAWLAAQGESAQAAAVRDEVRDQLVREGAGSPVLEALLKRVSADLDGLAPALAPLPNPPSAEEAEAIVDRVSGVGLHRGAYCDQNLLRTSDSYLSHADAPRLVAFVASDRKVGAPLFRRYVDIHASYGYPQYRSGSLWSLLAAVLGHPDQGWVREQLSNIGMALMAPVSGEFLEGLELAAIAQKVRAGDKRAATDLVSRAKQALAAAEVLPTAGATASVFSPSRESGDVWALHRRRLSALAEATAMAPNTADLAAELVKAAARLDGGFAGYAAPAYLTLAETASMVTVVDGPFDLVRGSLMNGLQAAHNIRNPAFALRMTARVNAMRERWWPVQGAPDFVAAATALARDAGDARFAALHVIGETFEFREADDVPAALRDARSLRDLAGVYQRPLPEFRRLNADPGLDADDQLPVDSRVNVPDPGYPPLLAARLVAGLLGTGSQAEPADRHGLIRRLVPVASSNATAQATTIGRLILATPTDDWPELDALCRFVEIEPSPSETAPIGLPS